MTIRSYWSSITTERISRRRALATSSSGAAGALLLAACGGGSDGGETETSGLVVKAEDTSKSAVRGGVDKWFAAQEPAHFDPHLQVNTSIIKDYLYGQMFIDKPGYMGPMELKEFEPVLASSYEWSPDLLTLTMKLRQGVKWHNMPPLNGRTVDVQDIISSWQRYLKTGTLRGIFANEVSPEAPITSWTAPDAQTMVIKLAFPQSFLVNMFASTGGGYFVAMSKEAAEGTINVRNTAIGNGAFMMGKYEPSQSMTFNRNPDYWEKDRPYVDSVEIPFVPEYATGLSQFKAGNIYTYAVRSEDVLATKGDAPALNVYRKDMPVVFNGRGAALSYLPGSPFHDERVRQALSLSYDRDLWLEVFGNISNFEAQGLPVDSRWFSAMGGGSAYYIDPKDEKSFGPNAKYYRHDVAEAKKLLAAAGHPNGVEVTSRWPTVFGEKQSEVLDNFAAEAGFKPSRVFIDPSVEYPKYRDGRGQFDGWAYIAGVPPGNDPVAQLTWRYTKAGGLGFMGFDAAAKGDMSGDPQVEDMVKKANLERDAERKKTLIQDAQRYLAKAQYEVMMPGQFSTFLMAWPALRNFNVYDGASWWPKSTLWIDPTQPPIAKT